MDFDDDDALDLLDDDGDGVNDMCLFFDEDEKEQNSQKPPQKTGCSVVLLFMGTGTVSAGLLFVRLIA